MSYNIHYKTIFENFKYNSNFNDFNQKMVNQIFKELETELKLSGFSNQTIKTYIYQNQKFLDFVNSSKTHPEYQKSLLSKGSKRTLEDITNKDLKAYLAFLISDRVLSPSSVNLAISSLKFLYSEVFKKNILEGIKHPKPEKKLPIVLNQDEIKAMIEATKNKKHRLIIELLYGTGLRVSEAVNMRVKDLHLDEKTAFVKYGKGKKERFVKLPNTFINHAKSYLKKRKKSSTFLFDSRKGPITSRQAERVVKNAALKAKINKKVFCHALRSSFATHMLDSGTDIRIIQVLLGHSSLDTTQRYTKVSKQLIMGVKSPLDSL